MSLLSDGIDDDWGDTDAEMGAMVKPTQQKSVTQQKSQSIGPDVPWKKILLWGAVSAGGFYVGHKIYKHYTAPTVIPPDEPKTE